MPGLSLRYLVAVISILLLVGCAVPSNGESVPTVSAPTEAAPTPDIATSIPPTIPPTLAAGASRTDANGIEQVWVPAGSFKMGTDDATMLELKALKPPAWVARELPSEQPQHQVTLTTGYWIDTYEVTNAAFQAFVDAGGYRTQSYWSEAGWQWLGKQRIDSLPRSCGAPGPRSAACLYHVVRSRGLRAVARWSPAHRSRMGIRRARPAIVDLSVGQ